MKSVSPPESKHALDLEGLRQSDVTFWSAYKEERLIACGALKELNSYHAEIKSMRTDPSQRGNGVAGKLLQHVIRESRNRGYKRLSLETGSMPYFEPARNLYLKFGFNYCEPFADYKVDPNSVFMTLELETD